MNLAGTPGTKALTVDDLRVGELLAEGGEGRVFELPLQPHLVFKTYRRAQPPDGLEDLVEWPSTAVETRFIASRLSASAAWPTSVVLGPDGLAAGLLLPRAPRRFALRHRDGAMRLSSLSYLTADPGHRAAAYGLDLPPPASAARLGIIYALARLLEAFEAGRPRIGHGDLSTKNVLWSLQRGPEVFVIDCDNCERFDAEGLPLGAAGRRRAMTPNWDDPAVEARGNPSAWTDRYSLALIFLRVVGAANFPMQARQREGASVSVDFPVPRGSFAHEALGPQSPVWKLCESGLGIARPDLRPPPGLWASALEDVLVAGGAAKVVQSAQAVQGDEAGGRPVPTTKPATLRHLDGDVSINPVVREAEPKKWEKKGGSGHTSTPWLRPFAVAGNPGLVSSTAPPVAGPGLSRGWPSAPTPLGNPGEGIWRQVRAYLRAFLAWWVEAHTKAASLLLRPGHRQDGLRAAAFCSVVDLVLFVIGLFLVGMIVAPIIGI